MKYLFKVVAPYTAEVWVVAEDVSEAVKKARKSQHLHNDSVVTEVNCIHSIDVL